MNYKEDDLILCKVEKIEKTSVFVKLPTGETGTIVTSEIAPGRIRNIRKYVAPNKKIVCKVLRISGNHIDLTLRRVTSKEKNQIMSQYKQEQMAKSAIHSILKEHAQKTEAKILKDFSTLSEFLIQAKENNSLIGKYIPKEFQKQIEKTTQKKSKQVEIKKILKLKCLEPDGMKKMKKILFIDDKKQPIKITYISAGKFQLTLKADNYKDANKSIDEILSKIETSAKQNKCEFEVSEKK